MREYYALSNLDRLIQLRFAARLLPLGGLYLTALLMQLPAVLCSVIFFWLAASVTSTDLAIGIGLIALALFLAIWIGWFRSVRRLYRFSRIHG